MTRKPSIFYVLSGVPSSLFPFVGTADAHLALAEEAGIRYALVDRWDGMAVQYIGAAVRQRPEAFCVVHDFGEGTLLLGILAPAARAPYDGPSGSPTLHRCPAEYQTGGGPADPILSSRIPLLAGL